MTFGQPWVAWDVDEHEDPAVAAELVSRACLKERINRGRKLLILHADNGNAMRAARLESRLEELGVLRSFSRHPPSHIGFDSLAVTAHWSCPQAPGCTDHRGDNFPETGGHGSPTRTPTPNRCSGQ
jgi:hypothetical protein